MSFSKTDIKVSDIYIISLFKSCQQKPTVSAQKNGFFELRAVGLFSFLRL